MLETLLLLPLLAATPAELVKQVEEQRLRADLKRLVGFQTRASFSSAKDKGRGVGAARRWLKGELERIAKGAGGRMTVGQNTFVARARRSRARATQSNVYAVLKGTKHPRSVIVFGAHYDSINMRSRDPNAAAPGANDNGSGTASVLEAARILSKHAWDRTIIFVLFAAEEQGLIGSRAMARHLRSEGYSVLAMLNSDIVGGVRDARGKNTDTLRCFSDPAHPPSRQLARLVKRVTEQNLKGFSVLLQRTADRPGRGGDHMSFSREGVAAIRLIETHENLAHQHNVQDLLRYLSLPYLAQATRADVAVLATLANGPGTPTGLRVTPTGTTLHARWEPVKGATGYLVAVRGDGLAFTRVIVTGRTPRLELRAVGVRHVSVAAVAGTSCSPFSDEVTLPR